MNTSPEQTVTDLAHFAWCGLVALAPLSRTDRHYPMRFCYVGNTEAQKQKRFARTVASDIERLRVLGRKKDLAASQPGRLEALWASYIGPVSVQSDLHRLTYTIDQMKTQGWVSAVISYDN